jgi:membrane protease YdiL (CAAX protease family)
MGYILKVFKNEREHRPRAFWRLLSQFILSEIIALSFVVLTVVSFAWARGISLRGATLGSPGPAAERMVGSSPSIETTIGVMSALGIVVSVWLATRFLDRRSFSDIGLQLNKDWWLDFGFGMALGALLMGFIFLTEWAAGWINIIGTFQTDKPGQPFVLAIVLPILFFIAVGVNEELLIRGYQLKNMSEGLNFAAVGPRGAILLAVFISSSVFGLLHLPNPNTTALSTMNIALAGFLLAAGYVLSGQLAIPIGLHITWNFFQGNVFGFPVSGLEWFQTTFIVTDQSGPQLWTGGGFGPEGGLLVPVATFVGVLLIILWVRYRYGRVSLNVSLARPPQPPAKSLPVENKGP